MTVLKIIGGDGQSSPHNNSIFKIHNFISIEYGIFYTDNIFKEKIHVKLVFNEALDFSSFPIGDL